MKGIYILMGPMQSRSLVKIILNVLILMTVGGLPARASSPSVASHKNANGDFLDAPIIDFSGTGVNELHDLCSQINMPCGFEGTYTRDWRDRIYHPPLGGKLHLKNTSARKILDEIVRLYPGHHWRIHDGVINVGPDKNAPKDLLLRKLNHLSLHGSSYMAARYVFIRAHIGIQGPVLMGTHLDDRLRYNRIDLELDDVTVREALNAIAKADGQAFWIYWPYKQVDNNQATFEFDCWTSSGIPISKANTELGARVSMEKLDTSVQP